MLINEQHDMEFELTCYVDGSYVNEWIGGIGYVLNRGSELVCYHSARVHVSGPQHVEAMALRQAIQEVHVQY